MNTYKIKNITKGLEKRDPNFNSTVIINYVDGMLNKQIKIKPDDVVYLTIKSLPISVNKLQLNGLVQITNHPKLERKPKMDDTVKNKSNKKKVTSIKPPKKVDFSKKITETPLSVAPKKEKKEENNTVKKEEVINKKTDKDSGVNKKHEPINKSEDKKD